MFGVKNLFKVGMFVGGALFGTAGVAILKSKDAKGAYTQATAAVLRGKDCVMKTVSTLRENCDDIYEDAKDINERRYAEESERAYQEAKALVEEHEAATEAFWSTTCEHCPSFRMSKSLSEPVTQL